MVKAFEMAGYDASVVENVEKMKPLYVAGMCVKWFTLGNSLEVS